MTDRPVTQPWNDPSRPVAERVDALLQELTLEEKAGQLGSYWLRPDPEDAAPGAAPMEAAFAGDRSTFEAAIAHGLGHITRAFGSAPVSSAEGVEHLRTLQGQVVATSRLGIPAIAHEECLTGFTTLGATCYPAAIAWGAAFDPALVREMARRIGTDMQAVGVHLGLSPVLDVVRDYRWGRVEETVGEDPYLVGSVTTEYVRGLQEAGVVATLKHFAGYSASRAGRNHAPVSIGPREFRDVVLVPFEMAVKLGRAGAVMNSYADVDGVPPAADPELLTGLLRERWGFEGTVVSDYWAVSFLESMHRVAGSAREAGIRSLAAGMDVELPETGCFADLAAAVREGELEESVLDRAVRRVLTQKVELGLLDEGFDPAAAGEAVDLDSPANRALARRMAEESVVLLKNEGVLPLAGPRRVAVIGPSAAQPRSFLGCYSFTNHVLSRFGEGGTGIEITSVVDALAEEFAGQDVELRHARGVDFTDPDVSGIAEAVAAAEAADVAVVTVGDLAGLFGTGTSGEGCDVVDLSLPGRQAELVEAVLATGTPVVLVLITGRPYSIGAFDGRCAAVVQAFMPGEEGGHAVAGVLSGRVNPSGRLPVGIPRHVGGQPGTYLAPPLGGWSEGVSNLDPRPLYPFGHGIGYSRFAYADLELSATEIATDGEVEVAVTVTNTSGRAGQEVVQLYLSDPVAQVVRPVKFLAGFAKIALDPGASARVVFTVHADRTAFTGRDMRRVVEPGEIVVRVGSSSEDLPLEASFAITGEVRDVEDVERVLTTPVSTALTAPVGTA
ncbi:MAG TPA: glycoside hydrolase family 3 N-terminal domain-containing protein [Kocuria rosea]|nr:glycoside hydrolase family 3 N-terminal domain-containing protein [Kocuria rosea]